jgi:hypothetical protein
MKKRRLLAILLCLVLLLPLAACANTPNSNAPTASGPLRTAQIRAARHRRRPARLARRPPERTP